MTRRRKMRRIDWLIGLAMLVGMFSCSVTKNLPDDEILYTGIEKVVVQEMDSTQAGEAALEEIRAALDYPPNNALLGSSTVRLPLPFGLWIYNALVHKEGKVGKWLFETFAAKPVLMTNANPEVRVRVAQNLLKENGYFRGDASYELVPNAKDPKQAKVRYNITMRDPYTIDSIQYPRRRQRRDSVIRTEVWETLIHKGDNFNVVQLEAERQRIYANMRNNGFYYYRPEYMTYKADTFKVPGKVWLRAVPSETLPLAALRSWKIGNITVALNEYDQTPFTDTLYYNGIEILYHNKLKVRPAVLHRKIPFRRGDRYSSTKEELAQTNLARLGIFKYSEMQFTPRDTSRRCDTLDLRVNSAFDLPLDGELEFNVTTKSNDQTGPGAIFSVKRKNVFGGGETFGVQLKGSYEWQSGKRRVAGKSALMNSWEFGISSTLTLPQLLFPGYLKRNLHYPSSTTFRIDADQMNRAKFFKLLSFGGSATLDFQSSETSHHSVTPFRLTYNKLQHTTATFDSIADANKALYLSLKDQFIPAISYSYTYDDTPVKSKNHHVWWQTSVTQSGNIISLFYAMAGKKLGDENKKFLGNVFSQFTKVSSEIRYNRMLAKGHHLVGRLSAGVIYGYGNAENHTTPYSEQFYIGGANSLRAFTIRSVGPGRFRPDPDNRYGYIDQTGDLKFEANLEYRFPIFGSLYGATFLDAGNIWLINNDPQRHGGQMKWGRFFRDLALGTGLGIRYDLDFIVFRVDCGIGLHIPYETGKKGYYNIPQFKDALGIHLAIGYPF